MKLSVVTVFNVIAFAWNFYHRATLPLSLSIIGLVSCAIWFTAQRRTAESAQTNKDQR